MAIDYLRQLAQEDLPLTVTERGAVQKVEMLLAADLVRARLERSGAYSLPHAAVVTAITTAGKTLLRELEARKKAP